MTSEKQLRLPSDDVKWEKNKSNAWPKLMYEDLVDYLIHAKAYDGKAMKSFRSLYGYNCTKCGPLIVRAKISPSQPGVGRKDYNSWIAVSSENTVETGHCTCPAGNARSCSHISAFIYAITLAWANGVGKHVQTNSGLGVKEQRKYGHMTPFQIWCLTKTTENQNSCVWTDSRKLRLTSSKVNDLPKTKRANPNKFVTNQIYPRDDLLHVMDRNTNQLHEPGMKVFLVTSLTEPYIAASPDGIIDKRTIVEIKCPTRPLEDLISSGKYDVLLEDGQPKLSPKGKNGYYCQVQVAMFCTESTLCKFVVWTAEKQCVVDVPYCKDFIKGILPRIRDFYFKHLLVRLTDEFQASRLKISPEYKSLCR
ncbi:LOW QUALITY PROTEIN: hypothetical protein MAR_011508 [Mya arenaria]|uniref:SWIM-type domain-containing protein n=1 Tax=Mya arenaria TaxID=6604 RepID=A0ABY7FY24_MYAAR|nr:LOW QUALITY PROTEIN: hypothetical protein MAR_011508 [Mya arenaria]